MAAELLDRTGSNGPFRSCPSAHTRWTCMSLPYGRYVADNWYSRFRFLGGPLVRSSSRRSPAAVCGRTAGLWLAQSRACGRDSRASVNDTAQALDRTLRIVRNLIGMAWSDGQILDALLT